MVQDDPEDHHGHCDHEGCDFVGNTNEDWENHSHDDGGTGGPQTCQFATHNDGNQCSYVFTGTEADQDHHHN